MTSSGGGLDSLEPAVLQAEVWLVAGWRWRSCETPGFRRSSLAGSPVPGWRPAEVIVATMVIAIILNVIMNTGMNIIIIIITTIIIILISNIMIVIMIMFAI